MRPGFLACALALWAAVGLVPGMAQAESALSLLPEGAESVTLPFEVQDGFILLSGQVAGVTGVFMFDTGTPFPVLINNTVVPVALSGTPTEGRAGSGQTFRIHRHADAGPVTLAGQDFVQTGPVLSGDLQWLTDEFRSDFLGFAGQPLIREARMTIDYGTREMTLDRIRPAEAAPADLGPGAVTLTFDGFDGDRPNLPYVTARLGDLPLEVMLDTGTAGVLELTPEAKAALLDAGALTVSPEGVALPGLVLQGQSIRAFAAQLSEGTVNRLTVGHATLSQYRSIWDFPGGTITLIPKP
jgi:hypothetical protein